jgi:hypothetical protein
MSMQMIFDISHLNVYDIDLSRLITYRLNYVVVTATNNNPMSTIHQSCIPFVE